MVTNLSERYFNVKVCMDRACPCAYGCTSVHHALIFAFVWVRVHVSSDSAMPLPCCPAGCKQPDRAPREIRLIVVNSHGVEFSD